jgi:hypothetical protein
MMYIDPNGLLCFDFNKFANQIRENRSNTAADIAALGSALAVGTMSKTPAELRIFGPKNKVSQYTGQLSRWNGRLTRYTPYTGRVLRNLGRSTAGVAAGALATGALITDGLYNWGVIFKAGYDATSSESENGECDSECSN